MNSSVLSGVLYHKRFIPKSHSFEYKHCMLLIDLDELEHKGRLAYLLKHNRIGLFSIKNTDYVDNENIPISTKFETILNDDSEYESSDRRILITTPSLLGYSFNPASCYLRVSEFGEILAVAIEVNNTFGESHIYPLVKGSYDKVSDNIYLKKHNKEFHVSPFISRTGEYQFEFSLSDKNFDLQIGLFQEDVQLIRTKFSAEIKPLTTGSLLKSTFRLCSIVLLTEFRILLQAYKLYVTKKLPFFPKPSPGETTTRSPSPGYIRKLKFPFK
ncbi:MAG: DUF1365 domain-containing protein [Chloroflexota bacterium]|nr:DUF1365 domain-containing protein [Chloroflexota bacterium]